MGKKGELQKIHKAAKELYNVIIRASTTKVDVNEYCEPRFDEIKRRIGYQACLSAMPSLIQKLEERPYLTITESNGSKKRINLRYTPLVEYHDKLAYGKATGTFD